MHACDIYATAESRKPVKHSIIVTCVIGLLTTSMCMALAVYPNADAIGVLILLVVGTYCIHKCICQTIGVMIGIRCFSRHQWEGNKCRRCSATKQTFVGKEIEHVSSNSCPDCHGGSAYWSNGDWGAGPCTRCSGSGYLEPTRWTTVEWVPAESPETDRLIQFEETVVWVSSGIVLALVYYEVIRWMLR